MLLLKECLRCELDAYDWDDDESEMAAAAAAGLKVSQHSYGLVTGWAYGDWSGNSGWHWFGRTDVNATEDYSWAFTAAKQKVGTKFLPMHLIILL